MRVHSALLFIGLVALPACWSVEREVSRVGVPGTELEVVLYRDVKNMDSYRLTENGAPVTEIRLLGPNSAEPLKYPRIMSADGIVTISWSAGTAEHFVKIDPARRLIVADSNLAGQPPRIGAAP